MTLKDMIDRLRLHCSIEIRDYENNMICKTVTDRKGVTPYLHYEVVSWFVCNNIGSFCVLIDDRGDNHGH